MNNTESLNVLAFETPEGRGGGGVVWVLTENTEFFIVS